MTEGLNCWRDFALAQKTVKGVVLGSPGIAGLIVVIGVASVFVPDGVERLLGMIDGILVLSLGIQVIYETWSELTSDGTPECLANIKERKKRAAGRLVSCWGNSIYYNLAVGLGTLLFIVPGIYVACMGCIGVVFVCIEEMRAAPAFDASWKLMKGHAREALRYLAPATLVFGVGGWLLSFGCAIALQVVTVMMLPENAPEPPAHPLGMVLVAIGSVWIDWVFLCMFSLQTRFYKYMKELVPNVVPGLAR